MKLGFRIFWSWEEISEKAPYYPRRTIDLEHVYVKIDFYKQL